ncbi:SDR family NAD(P)-dependent oxidoreductase [Mycolicibacterium lutetiense]
MSRFTGRVAIVTGAAGGLGRLLCGALLDEGARVIALDVNAEAGAKLEAELGPGCDRFQFSTLDVCDAAAVADVEAWAPGLTSVDVLINAAGIIAYAPIEQTSINQWDRVFDVNVRGPFLMTKAVGPLMADGGAIVNVSSMAGLRAGAGWAAYSASKSALIALTKVAAAELAPKVRVNVVCPGALDTEMPHRLFEEHPAKDAVMAGMAEASMLKRLGQASEVVPLCLFLVSEAASLITGASIPIDGGSTAW